MAITVPSDVPVHPITVSQYHRMIEAGVYGEDDRVELMEGVLVEMSPPSPDHASTVDRLSRHFAMLFANGTVWVRVQQPLTRRDDRSEPQPDLFVTDAEPIGGHPETGLLVVEVSVTSHVLDRVRKSRIYARAGIPEYWLVDVPAQRIEVRADPGPDGYASVRVAAPGDEVVALAVPGAPSLDVASLFAAPAPRPR